MAEKVALLTNTLAGGGLERAMVNIANSLNDYGYDVDFLLASCKGDLFSELNSDINIVCLDSYKRKSTYSKGMCSVLIELVLKFVNKFVKIPKAIRRYLDLRQYVIEYQPRVMLSSPTTATISMVFACKKLLISPVLLGREATCLSSVDKFNRNILMRFILANLDSHYKYLDRVLCVSESVRQDLNCQYNIPSEKCLVVKNPINIDLLRKKSLEKHSFDGFQSNTPFILAMGRLAKEKDFITLIYAFNLIVDKVDLNLIILGEGDQRDEIQFVVNQLELNHRIFMPGFLNNPYPYLSQCEMLVSSSVREGMPNVLMEAIKFNKKIIATNCSESIVSLIESYPNGFVAQVRSAEDLADKILLAKMHVLKKNELEEETNDYLNTVSSYL